MKHLVLRITERCNLLCRYCYANASSQADIPDMTTDLASRAVERACDPGGYLKVQFTGGEPLLNFEVVEAVYEFGRKTGRRLRLAIQTNGTLLDTGMCKRLREMRCGIGVSIDGIGERNGMRVDAGGRNVFDSIARGIWQLAEAGMRCNLTTVISVANAGRLDEMLDVALGFGNVEAIGFDMLRKIGRGVSAEYAPPEEALKAGLVSLLSRYEELECLGVAPRLREIERVRRRSQELGELYCYAQSCDSMAVDGLGRQYPCSSLAGIERFRLGSLGDGDERVERESDVRSELKPAEDCTSCKRFGICRGGCPAARVADGCKSPMDCLMHSVFIDYVERRVSTTRFA